MSLVSKLKQFKDLRQQAKKIEDVLAQEKVELEGAAGQIRLVMNGKQEIIDLTIAPSLLDPSQKDKLESALTKTFNEAIKKVQKMMASKMQEMGGLNLPGMR